MNSDVNKGHTPKKIEDNDFINIDDIYFKIAPYLSNPEIIKEFLDKHPRITKKTLIEKIEFEIQHSDFLKRTDFRILLNSL